MEGIPKIPVPAWKEEPKKEEPKKAVKTEATDRTSETRRKTNST